MAPQVPNVFTLQVQELRQDCNIYSVPVRWFTKIKDVKDLLHNITKIAPSRQQLFQSNSSIPLSSSLTMHDLKISKSGQSLRLSINDASVLGASDHVLNRSGDALLDEECSRLLTDVRLGLQRHNVPIKTDVLDCTGGVYFMRGVSGRKLAVFKPQDEEQGMPNNTKGYEGSGELGLRPFYKPGYGCMREVAAYLMDVDNYCSVPPTSLVHFQHPILNYPGRGGRMGHPFPKVGSLQKFIHAFDSFEDIGISVLSDLEVQKIALLDLRLLNCDRNASNILAIHKDFYREEILNVKGSKTSGSGSGEEEFDFGFDDVVPVKAAEGSNGDMYALVPIDHGYCMPPKLLINEIDWSWFYYPQINRPVHQEIKNYIEKIDIETTLKTVISHVKLSEDCIFLARISHQLVIDGIKAGLNLHEIAMIVARIQEDNPSPLEKAIEEAEENAHRTIEMRVGTISRLGKFKDNSSDERTFWKKESSSEKTHSSPKPKIHRKKTSVNEAEKQLCFLPYTHHQSMLHKVFDRDSDKTDSSAQSSQSDDSASFALCGVDNGIGNRNGDDVNLTLTLPDNITLTHISNTDTKENIEYGYVLRIHGKDMHDENALEKRLESIIETKEMRYDVKDDLQFLKEIEKEKEEEEEVERGAFLNTNGNTNMSIDMNMNGNMNGNMYGDGNVNMDKDVKSPESGPRVSFSMDTKAHEDNFSTLTPRTTSYKLPVDIPPPFRFSSPPLPEYPTNLSTPLALGALIQSAPVTPIQPSISTYFSKRAPVPLFDSFPAVLKTISDPSISGTQDLECPSDASSITDSTSTSTSSVSSAPIAAYDVKSHGGAKGMPYFKNLHGQPLQSIQSENDRLRAVQGTGTGIGIGTGLKRMDAINYHLNDELLHLTPLLRLKGESTPLEELTVPCITWQRSVSNDRDSNSSSCNTTDSDAASELFPSNASEGDNDDDAVDRLLSHPMPGHHALRENMEIASNRTQSCNFLKLGLNQHKGGALHHAHQIGSVDQLKRSIGSSNTNKGEDEGDEEGEGDGYRPNDDDDLDATDSDDSPQSSPLAMSAMIRVTSFSAFSSAPIYDAEDAERRIGKLKKERRRQVAVTEEFGRLRLLFAKNSIASLIGKALKRRHTISF